jgi:hypothetical protein
VISWGFAVMNLLKTSMSVKRGPPMAMFDYWTATNTKRLQFARLGVGFEAAFSNNVHSDKCVSENRVSPN